MIEGIRATTHRKNNPQKQTASARDAPLHVRRVPGRLPPLPGQSAIFIEMYIICVCAYMYVWYVCACVSGGLGWHLQLLGSGRRKQHRHTHTYIHTPKLTHTTQPNSGGARPWRCCRRTLRARNSTPYVVLGWAVCRWFLAWDGCCLLIGLWVMRDG